MSKRYCVYILASRSRILYTGVTSHLLDRVKQHREGRVPGFTSRYRIHRLVYFEAFENPKSVIAREKQIKSWNRSKKMSLVEKMNPSWGDLAGEFFATYPRKADPSPAKVAASG
jgi:putative endonuclease